MVVVLGEDGGDDVDCSGSHGVGGVVEAAGWCGSGDGVVVMMMDLVNLWWGNVDHDDGVVTVEVWQP
nr:hypothetical protein [Tanacetum cinerariifolium]